MINSINKPHTAEDKVLSVCLEGTQVVPISGVFLPWVLRGETGLWEDTQIHLGYPNPAPNPQRCCWVQPTPVSAGGDGVGVESWGWGLEMELGLEMEMGLDLGLKVGGLGLGLGLR